MEIKYGESLEFESGGSEPGSPDSANAAKGYDRGSTAKVDALKQIIRDGFRAPVGASHQISLTIGQKTYPVFNLGASGVGIYLNSLDDLQSKQQLKGMNIDFSGNSFKVDGRVVHISKDESHVLCGIELSGVDADCQQELLDHLRQCKNILFS